MFPSFGFNRPRVSHLMHFSYHFVASKVSESGAYKVYQVNAFGVAKFVFVDSVNAFGVAKVSSSGAYKVESVAKVDQFLAFGFGVEKFLPSTVEKFLDSKVESSAAVAVPAVHAPLVAAKVKAATAVATAVPKVNALVAVPVPRDATVARAPAIAVPAFEFGLEKSWGFPVGDAIAAPGDAFGAVTGAGTSDACSHFSHGRLRGCP